MRTYNRIRVEGGCYFFTVVLAQRNENHLLIKHIDDMRKSFKQVPQNHPYTLDAIVNMPDHLQCIWQLPKDEANFSTRWRWIKVHCSPLMNKGGIVNKSRQKKGARGIWQRRVGEHLMGDNKDDAQHIEYSHYHPVNHGHVDHVVDGKDSSFHQCVDQGIYPSHWAAADALINLGLK
ncbi:MAG: transposase [Gammaproteobacteria bacterium]|jgi:putative transposase|nr:transposase [Gammaproteobacteria bacterium]MBT5223317.1 transposase [Gammaproteobacteria bacterium]MBT5827029.1 transposase [Gammaproteobacteria bacterium]MBT5967156.1 transposase [Gammaproteobacteria bacterium]MBT6420035.1 transposase [Gammaproteobacteria bacterium]